MKASQNTLESLADIGVVSTTGDVRRIGAQMLLALARKEIPAADVEAAAKMMASQAALLATEIKIAKAAIELREKGGNLTKLTTLGRMVIGSPEE